jgi:hypothetical protein
LSVFYSKSHHDLWFDADASVMFQEVFIVNLSWVFICCDVKSVFHTTPKIDIREIFVQMTESECMTWRNG